jgi:hypothetical protein
MPRVTVYDHRVWDRNKGAYEFPPAKRTEDQIKAAGGVVRWETAEEVDETELDADGRYFPPSNPFFPKGS